MIIVDLLIYPGLGPVRSECKHCRSHS